MRQRVILGSAIALVLVLPAGAARRDASAVARAAATLEVPATANTFGAGRSAPPAGPGGVGTLPPVYLLPKGPGPLLLTFSSVTGTITCCKTGSNVYNGPSGRSDYGTNLTGVPGISGVKSRRSMFLAGVFLGATLERKSPPTETHTLTPELGQVFYVGNGRGGGGLREFEVPDGAKRLFLGIADGYNFVGKPSYYGDNAGSFTATFEFAPDARRRDVEFTVRAKKEISASAGDSLLADVRLSGSGRIVDLDGARQTRGRLLLTLVWLTRDDTQLTLKPIGSWRYSQKSGSVGGSLRVVKSDEPRCRNRQMAITLGGTKKNRTYVRMADPSGCSGGKFVAWVEPESELDLTIQEVRGR